MSDEIAKMAAGFAVQQNNTVVPFGKYRGMPVEVMRQDQSYYDWAYAQEDTRRRYPWIFGIVQVVESQDTPEHNSYQVLFLDQAFVDDVWDIVHPGDRVGRVWRERMDKWSGEVSDVNYRIEPVRHTATHVSEWWAKYATPDQLARHKLEREAAQVKLTELEKEKAVITTRQLGEAMCPVRPTELPDVEAAFEVRLTDYGGRVHGGSADVELRCWGSVCRIEIKPSMGDDYPSVLRQMKASGCNVLYLGHYAGSGATLLQVRKMFAASGIRILLD